MLLSKLRERSPQHEEEWKQVGSVPRPINGCDLTDGKYLYAHVFQGLSSQVGIILGFSISQEDYQFLSLQPGASIWFQVLFQDVGQCQAWGGGQRDGVPQPDRQPPALILLPALSGLVPHGRCHPI